MPRAASPPPPGPGRGTSSPGFLSLSSLQVSLSGQSRQERVQDPAEGREGGEERRSRCGEGCGEEGSSVGQREGREGGGREGEEGGGREGQREDWEGRQREREREESSSSKQRRSG